jgi:hypothetical protein
MVPVVDRTASKEQYVSGLIQRGDVMKFEVGS